MSDSTMRPSPAMQTMGALAEQPASSPRWQAFPGPSSPRPARVTASRLPSISANEVFELGAADLPAPTVVRGGFSPATANSGLPSEMARNSPRPSISHLHTSSNRLGHLSPTVSTPVDQIGFFTDGSPRPQMSSPRIRNGDLIPRSRRNSAAIVSIRLGSRSTSRTPRGSERALPGSSGQVTPSKAKHQDNAVHVDMMESWAPGVEEMDDWQPAGGMLLDNDDEVIEDDLDDYGDGRTGTGYSDISREVEDIMQPGMLFGEGREFQGEIVEPAIGRLGDDAILPLRRGGSEVNHARLDHLHAAGIKEPEKEKKLYTVIRLLGSGSYASVYLVREKGGRRREYALKCLSKQNLEDEQLETQLFEATIHLSLPMHPNIVTLHQTLQTKKWLFLMLELCPGEDLFYWLEKSRDASPRPSSTPLPEEIPHPMSSSKFSSSSIPFSSSQMLHGLSNHMATSFASSPSAHFAGSPASLLFSHHNSKNGHSILSAATPPTPSLLSAFSANTLLSQRRLKLIASMFSQMCEAVAICHDAGVSHRDIKPENFICCDSVELEATGDEDFGPQAKRKVIVKLTDFGLATTEEESGDVECGSKPYMSYECRNNLGPTYYPAPADVWSLGIVLINMLFHRNPWKDPTPGDINFDNFLNDPTAFLLSKFTGIGREVATYMANHILCIDVEARASAREFSQWVKTLPEMIGGRKAITQLKMARLEEKEDRGMFVKSPVAGPEQARKTSASALTTSAPTLSSLSPPPSALSSATDASLPTPDLERDDLRSATTIDEQPTPADTINNLDYPSPEVAGDDTASRTETDTASLSTNKRRKRGVRKGKAAQAAAAAAAAGQDAPSREERDALLAELAAASQSLARDLSKLSKQDLEDDPELNFPPLGTTPSQAAAAKKSKWRDMMKSSANPELAALARRVAERDAGSGGNWSAPAMLQHDKERHKGLSAAVAYRQQTVTASSGISAFSTGSALSSFGPISSATSSSIAEEEGPDWRKRDYEDEGRRGRGEAKHASPRKQEEHSRARKAQLAAAALTGMEPMGSFGKGPGHYGPLHQLHRPPQVHPPARPVVRTAYTAHPAQAGAVSQPLPIVSENSAFGPSSHASDKISTPFAHSSAMHPSMTETTLSSLSPPHTRMLSTADSGSTIVSSGSSQQTITGVPGIASSAGATSPNKPKLKGQIQSLAKMLSGLKTGGKGKD